MQKTLLLLLFLLYTTTTAYAREQTVREYTRANGRVVKGYTRHIADKIQIAAYTKSDGTKVKEHKRRIRRRGQ